MHKPSSRARLYFDHAASTPVDPRVFRAMEPYFLRRFGNPGSLHGFGQEAMAAVDISRETLARLIGADFRDIVFTGSATEANNLALRGAVVAWRDARANGASASGSGVGSGAGAGTKEAGAAVDGLAPRVIVSAIEHESVLLTARDLARDGAEVVVLPVDRHGVVDLAALRGAFNDRTAIVSVVQVNNEIGTVQPVAAIAAAVAASRRPGAPWPVFHTDAVQAFAYAECGVRSLGVDMMTLSGHKISGPKGIGLLYIRGGADHAPLRTAITGGGQEFGLRSGTENVPLIVGFAKAAELAAAARNKEAKRLAGIRARAFEGIKKIFPGAEVNGFGAEGGAAAPHILNVFLPGHAAEDVVVKLDLAGVAVSAGSACRARAMEPSYVVAAQGYGAHRAASSVRFSFGRQTTRADLVKLFSRLRGI